MRDYGTVHTSFWTSDNIRQMSDDGRILALYLLSGPHTTSIGCFRLPDGYVSEDLGWSQERVSKGFIELFRNGFATRDEQSKWVLVFKFLKWNEIENPNQGKAASKLFDQVPNGSLKDQLFQSIRDFSPKFPVEILNSYGTVSEPLPKPLQEPFRNQEQEQEQETVMSEPDSGEKPAKSPKARKPYPAKFEQFWTDYPTDHLMSKQEAGKVWSKLVDEDQDRAIASIPGFRDHCRKNPDYRPVHAVRYLTQRRFDGFAAAQPPAGTPAGSNGAAAGWSIETLRKIALGYLIGRDWPQTSMPEPGTEGSPVTKAILDEMRPEAQEKRRRMMELDRNEDMRQ